MKIQFDNGANGYRSLNSHKNVSLAKTDSPPDTETQKTDINYVCRKMDLLEGLVKNQNLLPSNVADTLSSIKDLLSEIEKHQEVALEILQKSKSLLEEMHNQNITDISTEAASPIEESPELASIRKLLEEIQINQNNGLVTLQKTSIEESPDLASIRKLLEEIQINQKNGLLTLQKTYSGLARMEKPQTEASLSATLSDFEKLIPAKFSITIAKWLPILKNACKVIAFLIEILEVKPEKDKRPQDADSSDESGNSMLNDIISFILNEFIFHSNTPPERLSEKSIATDVNPA
ncbi:MAG: hypothetical protein ACYCX4_10930 [Bacillota bacterium]